MRACKECGQLKELTEFYPHKEGKLGRRNTCKDCDIRGAKSRYWKNREKILARIKRPEVRAQYVERKKKWTAENIERVRECNRARQKRNAHKVAAYVRHRVGMAKQATPTWDNKEGTETIYRKARELGMHVDHIVPLRSKRVCGLHCWWNLQLLSKEENYKKGNRVWPDMPEEAA